jgi:hypothetical protein
MNLSRFSIRRISFVVMFVLIGTETHSNQNILKEIVKNAIDRLRLI